jgi:polyisoprenoid-binding protein YceI
MFDGTTELPLPDGVWGVDPQRSEIGFAVKAVWGLQTVRGVFGAYGGSPKVRAGGATGELTIEAGSLDSGRDKRDQCLRSPGFWLSSRFGGDSRGWMTENFLLSGRFWCAERAF